MCPLFAVGFQMKTSVLGEPMSRHFEGKVFFGFLQKDRRFPLFSSWVIFGTAKRCTGVRLSSHMVGLVVIPEEQSMACGSVLERSSRTHVRQGFAMVHHLLINYRKA
jgi:hypothetical protein